MLRGLKEFIKPVLSLVPAVRTADASGTGVDTQGFKSVVVEFDVGAIGDTFDSSTTYLLLEVQHSDTDSGYAACADADLTDPVTGTNTGTVKKLTSTSGDQNAVYRTGYRGNKRWVKGVWNVVGTHTNGTPGSARVVKGHPLSGPLSA